MSERIKYPAYAVPSAGSININHTNHYPNLMLEIEESVVTVQMAAIKRLLQEHTATPQNIAKILGIDYSSIVDMDHLREDLDQREQDLRAS